MLSRLLVGAALATVQPLGKEANISRSGRGHQAIGRKDASSSSTSAYCERVLAGVLQAAFKALRWLRGIGHADTLGHTDTGNECRRKKSDAEKPEKAGRVLT
jgi:hypothetical protein